MRDISFSIDHQDFVSDFEASIYYREEDQYIIKAIENDRHKSLHFLQYLTYRDYLPLNSEKKLHNIVKIFKDKFEDNQDLGFIVEGEELTPYFKVLYPEIIIKNSIGEQHTIKNLFVLFLFKYKRGQWVIDSFQGLRTTLSYLEFYYNYGHSHLPSSSIKSYFSKLQSHKFCLGSSTLGMSISEYNTSTEEEESSLLLEGILYTLDTYVTWESLEGVPHNYIRSLIPLGGRVLLEEGIFYNQTDLILKSLKQEKIPLDLDYGVLNNTIFIKNTLNNLNFFKNFIENSNSYRIRELKRFYCYLSNIEDTKFYISTDSSFWKKDRVVKEAKQYKANSFSDIEDTYTIFRGRKHGLVFSNYLERDLNIKKENIIIYPNFLKNVYRSLELELQKARLRSKTIKYLSSLRSTKNSIRQDQVTL